MLCLQSTIDCTFKCMHYHNCYAEYWKNYASHAFFTSAMKVWSVGGGGDCWYSCHPQDSWGQEEVKEWILGGMRRLLMEILCFLSPHPIFLPVGCNISVTDWQLWKAAGLRRIWFHHSEISFLGHFLGIDLKTHVLNAPQENMAVWPSN